MAKVGYVYRSGKALLMELHLAGGVPETFLLLPNTEAKSENEPTLKIIKKMRIGKNAEVGGVWDKVSDKGTKYKSASIESPFFSKGKAYFAIFYLDEQEVVKGDDGKERKLIATVNFSAEKKDDSKDFNKQDYSQYQDQQYMAPQQQQPYYQEQAKDSNGNTIPEMDIDDDEIQF